MGSEILRRRDCLGMSGRTGCNHKGPDKGDTGEVRGDLMTRTEPAMVHFEGGGKRQRSTGGQ